MQKKYSIAALGVLGTALLASSAAHADLTIQGAKGLPLNPTAELPQATTLEGSLLNLGTLSIDDPYGTGSGRADIGEFHFYGVHAAVRQSSRLEINGGVDHLKANNRRFDTLVDTGFFGIQPVEVTPNLENLNDTGISLGAKFLLKKGATPQDINIALGGGYSSALLKNGYAYLVGSKGFGDLGEGRSRLKLHLGVRYDRFRTERITASGSIFGFIDFTSDAGRFKSSKVSVYSGAEYQIGRDYVLIGEIQSKNNDFKSDVLGDLDRDVKTPYSLALRYAPKDERGTLTVGAARQGLTGDQGYFVQLGYKFGS